MPKRDLKNWATVFRGLGNPNRLTILQLLAKEKSLSVTELAEELRISFKNTSRNLAILSNLGFIEYQGRNDRVYYYLNPRLAEDILKILKTVIPTTG